MPLHIDHTAMPLTYSPSKSETVIIFDWDDTLLSSSFLHANQFKLDTPLYDLSREPQEDDSMEVKESREVALQLKELESCVVELLKQSLAVATRTVVITNAESGWVQLSSQKFLPAVVPLLESVTVISARSCFEPILGNCPLQWKYYAMHEVLVLSGFFGSDGRAHVDKHIISLGDSAIEREAVRAVCRNVPSTRTKSVKFAERPTIEQLRRQLELVIQCFSYISTHPADLDLQLSITINPTTNSTTDNQSSSETTAPPPSSHTPAPVDTDMSSDVKVQESTINTPTAMKCPMEAESSTLLPSVSA